MASPNLTPAVVPNPLSDFQKIGHNTLLYTPSTYSSSSPLILLCSWMGAAAKHIAKYTVAYRRLFPSARILLIRCEMPDVFRKPEATQELLRPALEVVREYVNGGGETLVHSFSNGGGIQLVELAKLWLATTGTKLPIRAQMIDSAPGGDSWKRSHAAITVSLPRNLFTRLFGSLMVHLLLLSILVSDKIMRREHRLLVLRRSLNDLALFDARTPRVYLFSKADAMVGAEEVEEHADQAAAMGRHVVKVRFEKSPHAGHIREDDGKYWSAVMEAWNRGSK